MLYSRVFSRIVQATFLGLCLLVFDSSVSAGGAPQAFEGKIVILSKDPPLSFPSKTAFANFLRQNSVKEVTQNAEGTWEFETMTCFKQPLLDFEVELVFYDITDGKTEDARRYVNSYFQYTRDHSAQTLSGRTKLIRPDFDANRTYMIVAQSRGVELARGEFSTCGIPQAQIDAEKRLARK